MSSMKQQMIGESSALMDMMEHTEKLALLNKPILVLGERGSGKELVAERLHYLSDRWDAPFIKLNCASMSETLLESELFGHESGAFTGASRQHKGRFERADSGTLFLDELGTCSSRVQEKLLRVIEYGELERVGGHKTIQVDVRLIGATNADLKTMAEKGEFRADLLDRLAFDVVHIPPLRARDNDLILLANHFAIMMCNELERPFFPGFTQQAIETLSHYHWPGNVRELKNVIERSIYRWEDPEQEVDHIIIDPFVSPWPSAENTVRTITQEATDLRGSPSDQDDSKPDAPSPLSHDTSQSGIQKRDFHSQITSMEKQLVEEALIRNHFNQQITAEYLQLSYHQLRAQLRKHNMLPLKEYLRKNNLHQD
ncbi:phage shock protein operon transcriptional activator [Oceanospirillum sediminis]|uniref:Phage shock protein operon transcriptional activator n=1 Tax=Oceanospirillum sediminis TaxID=2760088 RepID=A0A839IV02_9GAMM|nr:phage shock protein operon transcriptional activator [Oceanospirillum sediminis]MBB1488522.1 phage shock protein operon transcriptional activator [Oceanospirillum sediminis]